MRSCEPRSISTGGWRERESNNAHPEQDTDSADGSDKACGSDEEVQQGAVKKLLDIGNPGREGVFEELLNEPELEKLLQYREDLLPQHPSNRKVSLRINEQVSRALDTVAGSALLLRKSGRCRGEREGRETRRTAARHAEHRTTHPRTVQIHETRESGVGMPN